MNYTMTLAFYFLGMMVFIIWQLSNEEKVKEELIKPLMSDHDLDWCPTKLLSFLVCIVMLFFSLAWPYYTLASILHEFKPKKAE